MMVMPTVGGRVALFASHYVVEKRHVAKRGAMLSLVEHCVRRRVRGLPERGLGHEQFKDEKSAHYRRADVSCGDDLRVPVSRDTESRFHVRADLCYVAHRIENRDRATDRPVPGRRRRGAPQERRRPARRL